MNTFLRLLFPGKALEVLVSFSPGNQGQRRFRGLSSFTTCRLLPTPPGYCTGYCWVLSGYVYWVLVRILLDIALDTNEYCQDTTGYWSGYYWILVRILLDIGQDTTGYLVRVQLVIGKDTTGTDITGCVSGAHFQSDVTNQREKRSRNCAVSLGIIRSDVLRIYRPVFTGIRRKQRTVNK